MQSCSTFLILPLEVHNYWRILNAGRKMITDVGKISVKSDNDDYDSHSWHQDYQSRNPIRKTFPLQSFQIPLLRFLTEGAMQRKQKVKTVKLQK